MYRTPPATARTRGHVHGTFAVVLPLPSLASLHAWSSIPRVSRLAFARKIAAGLGPAFEPIERLVGVEGLAAVRLVALNLVFAAIPGGTFTMGLRPEEAKDWQDAFRPGKDHYRWSKAIQDAANPTRTVAVRPFLCSLGPLTVKQARAIDPSLGAPWALTPPDPEERRRCPAAVLAEGVPALLDAMNARLLSEAEWEWVARGGGAAAWLDGTPPGNPQSVPGALTEAIEELRRAPSMPRIPLKTGPRFGIWGLFGQQWVADRWHASYAGAPCDGSAWEPPAQPEVLRGGSAAYYPWQDVWEAPMCLCAFRQRVPEPKRFNPAPAYPFLVAVDLPATDAPHPGMRPRGTPLLPIEQGAWVRGAEGLVIARASDWALVDLGAAALRRAEMFPALREIHERRSASGAPLRLHDGELEALEEEIGRICAALEGRAALPLEVLVDLVECVPARDETAPRGAPDEGVPESLRDELRGRSGDGLARVTGLAREAAGVIAAAREHGRPLELRFG